MSILKIKTKNNKKSICLFGIKIFSYKQKRKFKLGDYIEWLYDLKNNKSLFVPFTKNPYKRQAEDTKIFAYYLPQFHAIPENDDAHGKGFTEWTNVASCQPQFAEHFQPKIPYDVGFYNLNMTGIMERQAEIAKNYGIYGFCFYYYWFSGKKVLEKPLEYFLKSDIDLAFHFCWANENWSKLWDGGNKEIILEQKLEDNDANKFFNDILPFIKDKRYEKIENKPLLMIYRPNIFEKQKLLMFLDKLNTLAQTEGFDGFYYMCSNMDNFNTPKEWGFEGIIEFPPHGLSKYCESHNVQKISLKTLYSVFKLDTFIAQKKWDYQTDYKVFKACFPSWDNLPRKINSNGFCFQITYDDFKKWLSGILAWTKKYNAPNEQYVYINAWNEWAEGAILEPTTRYGYQALDIVKKCLEDNR